MAAVQGKTPDFASQMAQMQAQQAAGQAQSMALNNLQAKGNMIQQQIQAASALEKRDHDTKMSIIRNLA
jgi:hypothetical protein